MDLVTLVCPPGAAEYPVSHGLVDYQPEVFRADHTDRDSARHVTVPRDVALHFLKKGGFALAKIDVDPVLSGETVRLVDKGGDLTRSCGVAGVEYTPNADGELVVAAEHAAELEASHGFMRATEKPQTKAASTAEAAKADTKAPEAEGEVVLIKAHEPVEIVKETLDGATKAKTAVRRPVEPVAKA